MMIDINQMKFPQILLKECDLSALKLLFNCNNHFKPFSVPSIPSSLKKIIDLRILLINTHKIGICIPEYLSSQKTVTPSPQLAPHAPSSSLGPSQVGATWVNRMLSLLFKLHRASSKCNILGPAFSFSTAYRLLVCNPLSSCGSAVEYAVQH